MSAEVVVTSTGSTGPGTFMDVFSSAQGGDIIRFDPALAGQKIVLANSLPSINFDLIIEGPATANVIIDGLDAFSFFDVTEKTLSVSNLDLLHPSMFSPGGGVSVGTGASVSLYNTRISGCDNSPSCQAPVRVMSDGTFQVSEPSFIHEVTFLNNGVAKDIFLEVDSSFFVNTVLGSQIHIEGSGNLYKSGSGMLELFPLSTPIDIALIVEEGTLSFTGETSEPIIINSGGRLIGNNTSLYIANAGIVKPGHSIGVITVLGDYSQTSSGTLQIELSPSGMSDLVQVGGTAFLDGTLALLPQRGLYFKGTKFTFLTAGNAVTGNFNQVVSASAGLAYQVNYLFQAVQIELLQNLLNYDGRRIGGNAAPVLEVLENVDVSPSSDLAQVMTVLSALGDVGDLESGLNDLHPAPYAALGWEDATIMHQIGAQLRDQRLSFCQRGCRVVESRSCCSTRKSNGLWISGIGEKMHQNRVNELKGFHAITRGELIGYDRAITEKVTLGIGAGYTYADLFWSGDGGKVKTQGYHAAAYTAFCLGRLLVDASLLGSYYHDDAKRNINFIDRRAKAVIHGWGLMEHVGATLFFDTKPVQFSPFASVDHMYLSREKFQEHGAGSVNLRVRPAKVNFLRGEVGLNVREEFCTSWGAIVPSASLSYVRFAQTSDMDFKAHLAGAAQGFTVRASDHTFHEIAPALSLGFIPQKNIWIALSYAGEFAKSRQVQELNFNLRWQF